MHIPSCQSYRYSRPQRHTKSKSRKEHCNYFPGSSNHRDSRKDQGNNGSRSLSLYNKPRSIASL
jgi:hypothetical protein